MVPALFQRLLEVGYFPRELPPTFTTKKFGRNLISTWGSASSVFRHQPPVASIRHSLARSGFLRRDLSIPNPAQFSALCEEISMQWNELQKRMKQSPWSSSRPIFHLRGG